MEGTDRCRIHDRQGAGTARNAAGPVRGAPPAQLACGGFRSVLPERVEGLDWQTPGHE